MRFCRKCGRIGKKKAWDQRQYAVATFIVNAFRNGLIPYINEYNTRLSSCNVRLGGLDSSFGRSGAPVSSQCSLLLIGPKDFQPVELSKLTLMLLVDGQISIGFDGKQLRTESADEYEYTTGKCPEAKAKRLLAELVGRVFESGVDNVHKNVHRSRILERSRAMEPGEFIPGIAGAGRFGVAGR